MENRAAQGATKLAVALFLAAAWAAEGAAESADSGKTLVLDTTSAWRMYYILKAPVAQVAGTLKSLPDYEDRGKLDGYDSDRKNFRDITGQETAAAPANWKAPTFDDSDWPRGPAVAAMRSPYLERLCLRGKFMVTDPAKVKGLSILVDYHGGAIVYVNGQEIGRWNVAAGAAMADEYPLEAFVGPDGKLIATRGDVSLSRDKLPAAVLSRIQDRLRKLSVVVPEKALRQGLNVVAVELIRAPYNKVVEEQLGLLQNHNKTMIEDLSWNTCEIKRVQLTAAGAAGLATSATRGAGFELWNSNPLAVDYDQDQGDAGPLQPIRLLGARNGSYSGKVVLGSDKPIHGLSATAGDLTGAAGTIPAAQVQVRYAMPWGELLMTNNGTEMLPYPAVPTPLAALYETAPKEIPVYRGAVNKQCLQVAGAPAPVFGAVAGIWVTVHLPKTAKPGEYTGQVMVSAEGLKPTPVAVKVEVLEWTIPDPAERRCWIELIQSPDTLSVEYGVPLWSQKHWNLIARSMDYIGAVGSRVLYAPLIAQSNNGNAESMVRWIKKGDGTFDYDFSVLDKYLDLAEKHMGTPKVVVFNVWDWYMGGTGGRVGMMKSGAGHAPPVVTVLDRATGKTENVALLDLFNPGAKAQWKPLFDQLKARMQKRGLEKTIMLGLLSDNWLYKEQAEFFKDVTGGMLWANTGHYTRRDGDNGMHYAYQSSMFNFRWEYLKTLYGWNDPRIEAFFPREPLDFFRNNHWRGYNEMAIAGNRRGVGRLGADTWYVVRDRQGRRTLRAWERFPNANWGYLNCNCAALAPGPDGAVATAHYEALREGLQECEARIAIEQTLIGAGTKTKVADLAKDYDTLMVERQKAFWRSVARFQLGKDYQFDDPQAWGWVVLNGDLWLVQSGWQERSEKLYSFAEKIAKKVGDK